MDEFNAYTEYVDLSALADYCREHGEMREYARGEVFTQAGAVGQYFGFVESGYFKYTSMSSSGYEAVGSFAFPGNLIVDYFNSFYGMRSKVTIVAGAKSLVVQCPIAEMREFIATSDKLSDSLITNALFRDLYQRFFELHIKTPTERYLELIKRYPEILDTISMRDLASFLIITPTHLSRIRKNLAK